MTTRQETLQTKCQIYSEEKSSVRRDKKYNNTILQGVRLIKVLYEKYIKVVNCHFYSPPKDVHSDAGGDEGEKAAQLRVYFAHFSLKAAAVVGTQHIQQVFHCLQFVFVGLTLRLAFFLLIAFRRFRTHCSVAVNSEPNAALDEVAVGLKLLEALKQFLGPFSSLVLHFEPEGSQVHEVACQLKKLKKGGGEGLWSGEQFGESFILGLKSDDSPGDHCFFVEFVEAVVGSESAVGLNNRRHKS